MQLFDNFKRTNTDIANHVTSNYSFINESAWSSMSYIRNLLENWSSSFPINADFISRFKSKNDQQHRSAFFELAIYKFFEIHGFHTKTHESNDPARGKLPDFHTSTDGFSYFTECTLSANPLVDSKSKRIKEQLCDVIEKVNSPDFFINIDFNSIGDSQPSINSFRHYINEKLEFVRNLHTKPGEQIKGFKFYNNGWEVEISFGKKSKLAKRPLGAISNGNAKIIDSQKPLMQSLDQKRGGKYGDFSEPYLIAINSTDITLEKSEIISTLYGSYSENTLELSRITSNSFFQTKGRPHNKRVSGVLLAHNFLPWNLHVASIELWHNPWAIYPFERSMLSIDEYFYVQEKDRILHLKKKPGKDYSDLLMIDARKMTIKEGL